MIDAPGPDDLTADQIGVALEEEMAVGFGTPPAYSDLDPNTELGEGFYTGTQSTGTTIWVSVTMEAGMHALF